MTTVRQLLPDRYRLDEQIAVGRTGQVSAAELAERATRLRIQGGGAMGKGKGPRT